MKCEDKTSVRFGYGSGIKSLGNGLYEALAVALGDEPDCDGEVFCPDMTLESLGLDDGRQWVPLLFAHGLDPVIGKKRLAKASFELLPRVGLKIQWRFDNPFDPLIRDIVTLCDEDAMAISSASAISEKKREAKFTRIIRWSIYEFSLTSGACAISGRTRVSAAKDFEGLSLAEMMRVRGLTEGQLLREQSEELYHRALATLGETKCKQETCRSCNHSEEWLEDQRAKRLRYVADEGALRGRLDSRLTAQEARERLKQAEDLLAETQKHAAEVDAERARLNLGPGQPFKHVEDWIAAGQKSFGCGFIGGGAGNNISKRRVH